MRHHFLGVAQVLAREMTVLDEDLLVFFGFLRVFLFSGGATPTTAASAKDRCGGDKKGKYRRHNSQKIFHRTS